jgi:hypothetical protein
MQQIGSGANGLGFDKYHFKNFKSLGFRKYSWRFTQMNKHAELSMLRNTTWTLSKFGRGKPQVNNKT